MPETRCPPPARPRAAPPVSLGIQAWTASCAAGWGREALAQALRRNHSGLVAGPDGLCPLPSWTGAISHPALGQALPTAWRDWDCRVMRLAFHALHEDGFMAQLAQARARWGAAKVGLIVGTSASTIALTEQFYQGQTLQPALTERPGAPELNTPHAIAAFLARVLEVKGPCLTVSTACSSSAKALGSAARWLRAGLVDAVVVAGVEALSHSLLRGFHALGLLSDAPCQPFGAERRGINVGEAAAFCLLTRERAAVTLRGYGESNDAHHMSAPHPQGLGAELALDDALRKADVQASEVGYLNLHGTATPQNDAVEAALVARRYASDVHASASKSLTGHTMGAAGLLEAALCWLALERGLCSGSPARGPIDPALGSTFAAQLQHAPAQREVRLAASHSLGFGGNNTVLIFGPPAPELELP
jgi:3-oxoacyl-[acyl-carrier-protein] synthase-1